MDIPTSHYIQLFILAASSLMDDFKCAFWVIFLVAALAALLRTIWCLGSCCVHMSDILDVAHANWLDFDPLSPGCGGCVCIIWWCAIGEEVDNETKWEFLRTIQLASCQNAISSSEDIAYTQDESCRVWLQVAGVSHRPAICNKQVRYWVFVNRDKLQCITAEMAWLCDIYRT